MNKKIYITSLHTRHGGCEYVISALANAFVRRGLDVEILCSYDFGEVAYPFDERVKVNYLTNVLPNREALGAAYKSGNPFRLIKEAFRSIRIIKTRDKAMIKAISQIDDGVIIATRDDHNVMLSKYGKPNVLKIAQLHHDHGFNKKLVEDFQKRYNNIDIFALLSPKHTEEVSELMKGFNNRTKCITIPNFMESVEKISTSPVKKQVIAAGRLHSDKDFFSLLRIWEKVCEKHSDYTLKIAGQGDLKEELSAFAEELKISDSVDLCGALPHPQLLCEMGESVCYAMTSVSECFPLVLLEAMSQGCPCVAFDVRVGPGAIITEGIDGFLIPDRDEEVLAERICTLIEDREKREAMSRAAIANAEKYSEENVIDKWMEIFS